MYVNEFETKENKIWTKDNIEPQHVYCIQLYFIRNINVYYYSKNWGQGG